MGETVKEILHIIAIAFGLFMGTILGFIYEAEIGLFVRTHPMVCFIVWTVFTLIFCFWRLTETYPEWRLWERLEVLVRKLRRK
jgi:hypothetical protein